MRLRTGRKNFRNLYLQTGDQPSDDDPCLGLLIDPEVAVALTSITISADDADLIESALTRAGR